MTSTDMYDISHSPPGGEVFIGLVGPVGVNLNTFASLLGTSMARLDYQCVPIKLSKWISEHCKIDRSDDYMKLKGLMDQGSECRRISERGDFLALTGLEEILTYRQEKMGTYDNGIPKIKPFTCYVFNQLKHPDEVKILRWIYGTSFYLVGVYSPIAEREETLAKRIENTSNLTMGECLEKARNLIDFDYSEICEDKFGQSIQKTFPLADVFFNESDKELGKSIDRFVETIFSNPFQTPTKDEQGMLLARNAALRSADLARQIGAAITSERGEVISIGCNEAARPGGGQYWVDDRDIDDKRDFKLGHDSNDMAKVEILTDLLAKMKLIGALNGEVSQLVADAVAKKNKLATALLFDVIEYFRSVHAEMSCLMDAARRGISVAGSTMYTTTFPCHECAKHIVAAGVKRLVYIEPYPKSKALELFEDAIALDETTDSRTTFESFVGIAPRKYVDLFELGALARKDSAGKKINWNYSKARLRKPELETTYTVKEIYYRDLYLKSSDKVATSLSNEQPHLEAQ